MCTQADTGPEGHAEGTCSNTVCACRGVRACGRAEPAAAADSRDHTPLQNIWFDTDFHILKLVLFLI